MSSVDDFFAQRFQKGSQPADPGSADFFGQRFEAQGEGTIVFPNQVNQEDLGPPGLESGVARFSVAEGRTFAEKLKAFKKSFPEGELSLSIISRPAIVGESDSRELGKEPVLLFRKARTEKWAEVDPGMLTKFEPVGDIVDFIGDNYGSVLGEIVSMTPQGRGMKLLEVMGRLFAGATIGDAVQQGIQEARGINTESVGEVASGAAVRGGAASAGGAAGAFGSKVVNAMKGGGFLELRRGAQETVDAARRLGVPDPLSPQVAINPAFRRAAAQSAAATSPILRYVDDQQVAARRALDTLRDVPGTDLRLAVSKAEMNTRENLLRSLNVKTTEATTAGRNLQKMVEKWDDFSRTQVDGLYKNARAIEEPQFDLTSAKAAADRLELGVIGIASDGKPLRVSADLKAELQSVIADIKALDPSLPTVRLNDGTVISSIDQLQALKQRLFDLKTPDAMVNFRQEHALANQLYKALNEVISAPRNTNPAFVEAWKTAERAAAKRFDMLEMLQIQRIAKSETPSTLATRLAQPNNAENLALLKRMKRPEEYEDLRNHFKTRLLDEEVVNPGQMLAELNRFDRPTLNMLLTKDEQVLFRGVAEKLQRLSDTGIQQVLRQQEEGGRLVAGLFRTGNSARINEMHRMVMDAGGPQSELGKSIRAGLIDDIIQSVTKTDKGGTVVDFKALDKTIRDFEKDGLTKFLTSQDLQHLKDQRLVAEAVKDITDAGTSIAGAEASGSLFFRTSEKAIVHMIRLMGFGRLLTLPGVSKFLIGTGKSKDPHTLLKIVGAAAGSSLASVDKTMTENGVQ